MVCKRRGETFLLFNHFNIKLTAHFPAARRRFSFCARYGTRSAVRQAFSAANSVKKRAVKPRREREISTNPVAVCQILQTIF